MSSEKLGVRVGWAAEAGRRVPDVRRGVLLVEWTRDYLGATGLASWQAGAQLFEPAPPDLRMNHAAARFTKCASF